MSTHPPLNTPLSAFTPAMLDALPVGSAFGAGEEVSGVMVKDDRGWRPAAGGRYAPDFGAPGWDQTRPLIRVGPEQASESVPYVYSRVTEADLIQKPLPEPEPALEPLPFPVRRYGSWRTWNQPDGEGRFDVGYEFFGCAAGPRNVSESRTFDTEAEGHAWLLSVMMDPGPLPEPWPGYRVEYDDHVGGTVNRSVVRSSYTDGTSTIAFVRGVMSEATTNEPVPWASEHVREVRDPGGTVLWARPAAKVTTETEKVPEAYRHAPEDSYHWKKYHAPGSPDFFPVEDCRACRDLNAKVTTEPRPLSTYTADEIRAFPVGTVVGAYRLHDVGWIARIPGAEWEPAIGPHTPAAFVVGPAPFLAGCDVHFPAKVTP